MENDYQLCSIRGNTILVYTSGDTSNTIHIFFSQFGSCRINTQNDGLSYVTYDNLQHLKQARLALRELNQFRNRKLLN